MKKSGYIYDGDNDTIERRKGLTKLTRYEMETTVNFNADDQTAVLYTRDRVVMRRLDRLVKEFPDLFKCVSETELDKTYEFPKKYAMPRRPRIFTDEQREQSRKRLAKARGNRQDDDFGEDMEDDGDEYGEQEEEEDYTGSEE